MMNSIIYMPMHHYSGAEDDKIIIAIGIAITALSLITYLIGYLYEGIRNKNWSISDIFLNPDKAIGGFFLVLMSIIWILAALVMGIYKYL